MPGSNPPDLDQQAAVLTLDQIMQLAAEASTAMANGASPNVTIGSLAEDDNDDD